ncbi:ABC transporter ATP-binding protein [Umezawaea tangerina]|uniref:Amino acid/amide ABC transporter ATP-binding protein 2 (HAAT family) n=1 Tax=Umezawaea tangerina TaxID=84725 RepID=A0A2T0SZ54_9PSEU|nr:ABC transporter ATP-binding protein [Umezawaea tangerina]PRY38679.1 amino acid/amide ABC transporter ATP-binding protein 2 (HAAT family) [Umezawaea tangerina]
MTTLEIEGLSVRRGRSEVLHQVDLVVREGECVCLVGSNGAGKTSLIEGVLGMLPSKAKTLSFLGESLLGVRPWDRVRRGLVVVPQNRDLFSGMTVEENLRLGAVAVADRTSTDQVLAEIYELFPRLAERADQLAGTLSGGERSMLAIGRGLMSQPRMLVFDEPSLGLAPLVVTSIMRTIAEINERGTTVLLVEQNVHQAFALASRAYVLENGVIAGEGPTAELADSELMRRGYLGSAATGGVVKA